MVLSHAKMSKKKQNYLNVFKNNLGKIINNFRRQTGKERKQTRSGLTMKRQLNFLIKSLESINKIVFALIFSSIFFFSDFYHIIYFIRLLLSFFCIFIKL